MISRSELATLIDAYAAAKVSNNNYLVEKMINELEEATNELYSVIESIQEQTEQLIKEDDA